MERIHAGLTKPRTKKKYGKIMKRIGRLKQKYGVGNCYDIEIEQQDGLVKAIRFKKNWAGQLKSERVGDYVIRTDRVDLDESTINRLSESGLNYTWNSVRNMLSSHDRVVTSFNTEEGECIHVRNTTRAKLGAKAAVTAATHKLARILYAMVKTRTLYEPQRLDLQTKAHGMSVIQNRFI